MGALKVQSVFLLLALLGAGCITNPPDTVDVHASEELASSSCEDFSYTHSFVLGRTVRSTTLFGERWLQLRTLIPTHQSELYVELAWKGAFGEDLDLVLADRPIVGKDPDQRGSVNLENKNGTYRNPDSPAIINAYNIDWRHWWFFISTDESNLLEAEIPLTITANGKC